MPLITMVICVMLLKFGIVKLKPRRIYWRFDEPVITHAVNVEQVEFKWVEFSMKSWHVLLGQRTPRISSLQDVSRVKYLHGCIGGVLDALRYAVLGNAPFYVWQLYRVNNFHHYWLHEVFSVLEEYGLWISWTISLYWIIDFHLESKLVMNERISQTQLK